MSNRSRFRFYSVFGGERYYISPPEDVFITANGVSTKRDDVLPPEKEIALCIDFLRQCEPCKTPTVGSYQMKHVIEKWCGQYVCNGAFIEAAKRLNVPYFISENPDRNPNAVVAIKKRSIKKAAAQRDSERIEA